MIVREKKELLSSKGKNILFTCIAVLPLLLLLFPAGELSGLSFVIFPGKDAANRISALTDKGWNGNSVIKEFSHDDKGLVLKYILKEGAASPLVFISLNLNAARKPLDISRYKTITLQIKAMTTKRVMLFIKTFEPGISLADPQQAHTLRHNQYILQFIPGKDRYTINLDDFITPPWWTDLVKVNAAQLTTESYKKVVSFDMQFNQEGADQKLNRQESIEIERIFFSRPMSPAGLLLVCCVLLFYLIAGIYLLIKRLRRHIRHLPEQKPLDITLHREMELQRIKRFIETNYHNSEISTGLIYRELGIPQERVFKLVKEEYKLTFKQLIHTMRIREAKRLLKETDLRIIDIALNLGFNNISYFNNIFKKHTGQTPSAYREIHS